MSADASLGAQCTSQLDMEAIAQNIQFLSDRILRVIAKGPLMRFTHTCRDDQKINRVWQSLIKTLSTPSLSHLHTTAACNAVTAFVDAALASENKETRRLALLPETWLAIFDVFLNRYEDAKPKPLKQLLGSLTTTLSKHYHGDRRIFIQAKVVHAITPSILLGEPSSRLKGCLVLLEIFIRKSAMLPSELISLVREWLAENQERWMPQFGKAFGALSLDTLTPSNGSVSGDLSDEMAAKIFVFGLLVQTNNREMASSTGVLMASFLQRLRLGQGVVSANQPLSMIWVAPVRHLVLQNLDTLEAISTQILEPIFNADPSGFHDFIATLPLKTMLVGDMTEAPRTEYMLLFATLQVGKKLNLVHEDYEFSHIQGTEDNTRKTLILKSETIGKFLFHRESNIRMAALALLITTFSTRKPLMPAAMKAILRGLPSMHADSDSYTRGEIMSLTRKLIIRLKSGMLEEQTEQALEPAAHQKPQSDLARSDTVTKLYLKAYIDFLVRDLRVTASYPRHISALKALKLLLDSGLDSRTAFKPAKSELETRWKFHMEVFDARLLRSLVDLLLDPFEEVRATALSILNLFPQDILMCGLLNPAPEKTAIAMRLTDAIARAEIIASKTSRADHADTVARLYHIMFCGASTSNSDSSQTDWWANKLSVVDTIVRKLEERLSSSNGLFNASMREAPLHGYVSGLRYIVLMPNFHLLISNEPGTKAWRSIHDRIVSICDKIWLEVKAVLCVDSPEGHTDEPVEDLSVGPKDILSYSWRALRESSLLLHATMDNATYGPPVEDGLQRADFERVGHASFTQLAELRHRGAFSTVSRTFATCCQRCIKSDHPSIQELPRRWYQEAKATIFESASKLTRRSAGLPAMMTGILCADAQSSFFTEVMNELHEISRLEVEYDKEQQYLELPQVHSMNCLKDIFTSTKLGQFTDPFIMSALTLSAERLGSPIWALRNSGLMLFRALLMKMCRIVPGAGQGFGGSSGSEPGARVSFAKYPGMLELLSKLLTPVEENQATQGANTDIVTERVFPALELVGEKIPTLSDDQDARLRALVLEHTKSPVWGIREHAARVYASLLTPNNILEEVQALMKFSHPPVSENCLHGTALCVRYALRRFLSTPDVYWTCMNCLALLSDTLANGPKARLDDLLDTIRRVFASIFPLAKSPYTATALVEILNDTIERGIEADVEHNITSFLDEVFQNHDIRGVLGYVFDATSAGWNLSSRTRSSSLLRRALSWCMALKMISSGQGEQLPGFYHDLSTFDAGAACWIAEQLHETLNEKDKYRQPLANLFTSVVLNPYRADVKTVAVSNLASILESLLPSEPKVFHELALPWEDLYTTLQSESNMHEGNRPSTDAELRLRGCLLAIHLGSTASQCLAQSGSDLRNWVVRLRYALSEETEFTTRYAAMASLANFAKVLRPLGQSPRVDSVFLDTYLALYDMLNDDDEEIRDTAASSASWILSYSSVSPDTAIALSPLNVSALLAEFIADNFSGSLQLAQRVVAYITGQTTRVSDSGDRSRLVGVSELLTEMRQESTILFVEEKQNLFVDEVREVDIWAQALQRLNRSAFPEILVLELSRWVFDGMAYLSELAKQDTGRDGLLGWTSKPETFTLGVRLIRIASTLAAKDCAIVKDMEMGQHKLQEQLQSLLPACERISLHHEWLGRIQGALERGVDKAQKIDFQL